MSATVVHWYWRHGVLGACKHSTVREAARCAWSSSGAGEEATVGIEVVPNAGGELADVSAFYAEFDAAEDAEIAEAAKTPPVAFGKVRAPGTDSTRDDWASYEWYYTDVEAKEKYPKLIELFGADRVKLYVK